MWPYKIQKVQELGDAQKKVRLERCKMLKGRCVGSWYERIIFTDEKIFTVEQVINKQNDRLWAQARSSSNSSQFQVSRSQGAQSVMVWAGITANGRTPLVFVEQGVKINAQIYKETILEDCLKPWAQNHFGRRHWVLQQDSAPAHKANLTQNWLKDNIPEFISASEWPPYSPDLNPMDFCIWGMLESKVCSTRHHSLDSLKRQLEQEWQKLPQHVLRTSVDAFKKRLDLIVRAKGGHIENYQ